MGERVMIFIDGSNLYHSLKNYFNRTDLDLGRFCQKLITQTTAHQNLLLQCQGGTEAGARALQATAGFLRRR